MSFKVVEAMKINMKLLSSLTKVFLDEEPKDFAPHTLSGFRNEVMSFQVAWRDVEKDGLGLTGYSSGNAAVTVESPIADVVRVRQVNSVPVRCTTFEGACDYYLRKEPGLFPDLLTELNPRVRVFTNQWDCLWIDVEPKADTQPGVYPVTITLKHLDSEETASVTQLVEILPGFLPAQKLIHTKWFHCDGLCQYYHVEMFSDEFFRICENFVALMVKRGINMCLLPIHTPPLDTAIGGERMTCQLVDVTVTDGKYSFGFENLEKWVAMCKRCGVEYYEVAHLFSQWGAKYAPKIMATVDGEYKRIFGWETAGLSAEYTGFVKEYVTALLAKLKELGIDRQCWFHISDEPNIEQLEDYKAAKGVVADVLEGYHIMDALSSYEFYASGAVANPVPANNHIEPFLANNVPNLWTYYCCGQFDKVSNMFISMPSARNRILAEQLYKFGIVGFLQWGYNFYNSQHSVYPINPYLTTDADGWVPAGDPFQVYPGEGGVPEESIRIMVTAHAMQDLRAMQWLESLTSKEYVMHLIEGELEEKITFTQYPHEDEYLLSLREKVNREIVKALN